MALPPGGGQDPSAPFKPFILGRYNVLLPLGEGGMAQVYLAEQTGAAGFTRLVTIKRIKTSLGADTEFVRMFVDEARILVNIQHPNVVSVLDLQQQGPDLFMVLEYVNGGDLRHLLKALNAKSMFMPVPVAVYVGWSMLRGLVQAHEARGPTGQRLDLIHRDVSPGNILLGRNGAVKLSDFGVAKAVGRLAQTTDGAVKGSLSYMAPELLEHASCDQRADVFSAGVVLWEMLTCRRLFPGTQPNKLVEALLTKDIPPPSSFNPDVPTALDSVVLRALARKPEQRFQSARALEMALHPFIREHNPDELEGSLAKLVGELVLLRTQEELAALPRATEANPDAANVPDLSNVRLDDTLGIQGPPPMANSVDDFFVHGNAFNPADVAHLPKPGADDFFLAPPAIETQPPAATSTAAAPDDFFDVVAPIPPPVARPQSEPAPTPHAAESMDFSSLGDDEAFGAVLAQPLPAPPGAGAPFVPSFTAMVGDLEVPPVTMPVGASQPVPSGTAAAWSSITEERSTLMGDTSGGAPTLERSTAGLALAPAAAALPASPPGTPAAAPAAVPAPAPANTPRHLDDTLAPAAKPAAAPAPAAAAATAPAPAPLKTTITAPPTQNIASLPVDGTAAAPAAPVGPASPRPAAIPDTLTGPPLNNMGAAPGMTPLPLAPPAPVPDAVAAAPAAPRPSAPGLDTITGPPLNNMGAAPGMTPVPLVPSSLNDTVAAAPRPSSPALDTLTAPPLQNIGAAPGMTPAPLSVLASLPAPPPPPGAARPTLAPSSLGDTITGPPINNMGAAPGMTPAPLPVLPPPPPRAAPSPRASAPSLDTITAPPILNISPAPGNAPSSQPPAPAVTAGPPALSHGGILTGPPINNMGAAPGMTPVPLGAAAAPPGAVTIPPASRAVPLATLAPGAPVDGFPVDAPAPPPPPQPAGLVASHKPAADDFFSLPPAVHSLDPNATVEAGPSWGDLAAESSTEPKLQPSHGMAPAPGSPWATTLPPPGATGTPSPAPGPFCVAGMPGRPDGWRATAGQLWTALLSLPAADLQRVRLGLGNLATTPAANVAARLCLDHLVAPPVPVPPPKDVPLDMVGLKQAFTRLAVSKATGMLLLKQDNGNATALYVMGGNLHHVQGAHLGMPLMLHLCPAGVESPAFNTLLTRILSAEQDACTVATQQGLLPALDPGSALAPWLRARLAAALAPGRFQVSFCPGVTVPFNVPPSTMAMSTLA